MESSKARTFCERIGTSPVVVSSADEFSAVPRDAKTVTFLDDATLAILDELASQLGADDLPRPEWRKLVASLSLGPSILISKEPARTTVAALHARPWLSHVLGAAMLEHSLALTHLQHVVQAATTRIAPRLMDWMGGPQVSGRRVRIAVARRRFDRLDRMSKYVASKGTSPDIVDKLRAAAEELLTNAFYNAPVAAGAAERPIPRNQDVSLPEESACDLAYGCHDDLAFVRVRDPFGSLSRTRLVEVLARSTSQIDDSMGGSGLGLHRIMSAASLAAISVVGNQHTEVLVGYMHNAAAGPRPYAFHMFFKDSARRRLWKSADQDTAVADPALGNTFVSIVLAPDGK